MFNRGDIKDIYPLTPMQEGMLFHSIMDQDKMTYFEQTELVVEGDLDIEIYQKSLDKLIERYDVLRTVFMYEKVKMPVQMVLKQRENNVYFEDITSMNDFDKDNYVERFKQADRERGFDLTNDTLIRVSIIKVQKEVYEIIWSFHHIVMDGWCMGIIINDSLRIYQSLKNKTPLELPETHSYNKYISWLQKQDKEEALDYWKKYLDGYEEQARFPDYGRRRDTTKYEQGIVQTIINEDQLKSISKLAQDNQVTLNTFFQTIWGLTLQQYTGKKDVVFGTVVSGRPEEIDGIENMVGIFINTVPLRVKSHTDDSFAGLIQRIQENSIDSRAYEYSALADIQASSMLKQDLLDHIMVFENYPLGDKVIEKMNNEELGFSLLKASTTEQTNYNLNIFIVPEDKKITLKVMYNENHYNSSILTNAMNCMTGIIEQVVENPQIKTEDIQYLGNDEMEQLIYAYNDTYRDLPDPGTIHELFETQVARNPNHIALIHEGSKLTYMELNEKANQLARMLRDKGVTADSVVGIMVDRSSSMVIGELGILKAGGAYLPIDPESPEERISLMLQNVSILLTQKDVNTDFDFKGIVIKLDDTDIYQGDSSNLSSISTPENLAYVMYTSGSTGSPKGVMIEHRNVMRLVKKPNFVEFHEDDRILLTSAIIFDVATFEIWGALLNGLRLYLVDKSTILDARQLENALIQNEITILWLTSPLFNQLSLQNPMMFSHLRYLLVGGDVLSPAHINSVRNQNPNLKIVNGYGPTENTTFSTCFLIDKDYENSIPIGKPISNSTVYILDKNLRVLPKGVAGELCVGGDGVGRGYINDPELTFKKFISNPFVPGQRMYRTGDLAKWLPDGNIEFLGRMDRQVKIRGYRIELGEIESKLNRHPQIGEVVVIATQDELDGLALCAYIVPKEGRIEVNELKEYLGRHLPDYMIPTYFTWMDKLPYTPNGKLDRNSLPKPSERSYATYVNHEPLNELEQRLAVLWKDILRVSNIGVNDNFFDIGGHSLKATVLCGRMQKELGVEIGVRDIFENPTISKLANKLKVAPEKQFDILNPLEKRESYPVSSGQKRLYALQMIDPTSTSYNMPIALELRGTVDILHVQQALKELAKKHESLRTSFHVVGEEIVQKISQDVDLQAEFSKVEGTDDVNGMLENWTTSFSLDKAPLMRVKFIKVGDSDVHVLLLDMHHIISDGTSMRILFEDFVDAYRGADLISEEVQYKEYAYWENNKKETGQWDKQKQYWKAQYEDGVPVLELPSSGVRGNVEANEGVTISFEIDKETLSSIKQAVASIGGTLYMVLMAGYSILLSKYSGQEDIVIGCPIAGRRNAQMERVMGMFLNTLAIRTKPEGGKRIGDYLKEIKQTLLNAYENQEYPFEELVQELNVKREASRNPLFDVMFILQNTELKKLAFAEAEIAAYRVESNRTKFDMTFDIAEQDGTLLCEVEYNSALFDKKFISQMIQHYIIILRGIAKDREITVGEIELLTETETRQLLEGFNDTKTAYQDEKTIHELFEAQVEKVPDKVAITCQDKSMTYRELNNKANQLARVIRNNGVQPDDVVGLMVDRSLEMVVGLLGILKSGAAYLPIDYRFPKDRIKYMVAESGLQLMVSEEDLIEEIDFTGQVIDVKGARLKGTTNNLEKISSSKNLAYVIYTSGSTGKPKGVMVEHKAVVNFLSGVKQRIDFNERKVMLSLTTVSFDIFGMEMFLPLIQGMKVVIAKEYEAVEPERIIGLIEKENVTMLQATPSRIKLIIGVENAATGLGRLEEIMVGGEEFSQALLTRMKEVTDATIYNMYGPTETTIWSTMKKVTAGDKLTIGTPIANTSIYITDKYNRLCPIGVPGELNIAGDGLARGYYGNPELTSGKFVDNPFKHGIRMYKTGDKARWLWDGSIDFMGRLDKQVKIRGYRIELEEIEATLKNHEGVKEAVVLVKESKHSENNRLCAYLILDNVDIHLVKHNLSKKLPNYMLPSSYVVVNEIPLTQNGKIDKLALMRMEGTSEDRLKILPKDYQSNVVAEIWKEVLGIEDLYIDDDFFEMGGNSINIVTIASRIKKQLGIEVTPADLMVHKTIREFSENIASKDDSSRGQFKNIFKINKSKSEKNIFIIHGGDADIFYYRHLAKLLEDEYSVYALQPTGLHSDECLRGSYNQMTRDYAKEIRMIQSEGPYIIAGYCVGGYISYDLAAIFEAQGDKVSAFLQIDQEAFVHEKFFYKHRQYINNFRLWRIEKWRVKTKKEKAYTFEKLQHILPKSEPISQEEKAEVLKERKTIMQYFCKRLLFNGYAPIVPYIKIPTLVVKAEENNHYLLNKESWVKMARGPLEFYEIPGGHETLVLPPYVGRLAEIIKDYLQRTV